MSVSSHYSNEAATRTPTKNVLPYNVRLIPTVSNTVDLFNSPRKKSPPWKGSVQPLVVADEDLPVSGVVWFANKYPETPTMSNLVKTVRGVEIYLRMRFPKCLPIAFELLEFLAHIRSSQALTPVLHEETLLVNDYATAMPLIWFSGIIYSQTLVMTVATRLIVYPKTVQHRPRTSGPRIWNSPLPIVEIKNKEHSYQFWVVHLNGSNGKAYCKSMVGNQKPVFNNFKKSLVAFF